MHTIYKYQLEVEHVQYVSMPMGAKILCVQTQHGKPRLWALVDKSVADENLRKNRTIHTYGTGHEIIDANALEYIGTYQLHEGQLLFHVFEEVFK